MLTCPACNTDLRKTLDEERKPRFYCPSCDWGSEERKKLVEISRAAGKDPNSWASVEPARGWRLVGLWLVTPAMLIAPWIIAWFLLPFDLEELQSWALRYYWPVTGVYIFICAVWNELFLQKIADWWGRGRSIFGDWTITPALAIDYHASHPGLLLFPGKVVVYTLYSTWRLFF